MSSGLGESRRRYRMGKRAEGIDDTRLRIIEATVGLHGTVGPGGTTVVGIAQRAGVTRATVYRHFPDETALFEACSAHWLAQRVPPDPSLWADLTNPLERTRAGLADLYRFYKEGEPMLARIYRDKPLLPERHRDGLDARDRHVRDLLFAAFPSGSNRSGLLHAVLGHAITFWTWRSLCVDHGLKNDEAVELMVALAAASAGLDERARGESRVD